MAVLPRPPLGRTEIVEWVSQHLGHLACDEVRASPIRGGQAAADLALRALDVTGYASRRSAVLPVERRGATRLSPYIRHGLLDLPTVWDAVAAAPPRDRSRYRDELLWQEFARHLYARVGNAMAAPLRFAPPVLHGVHDGGQEGVHDGGRDGGGWAGEAWPPAMACMAATTAELHADGWLVNQTRMWLSSQYTVRAGGDWLAGEDEMFRHLLDGSRAANRLGWQWTIGTATGKVYGFSRWQVEKRAPGLCDRCALERACPIQDWPSTAAGAPVTPPPGLGGGPTDAGPVSPTDDPGPVSLTETGRPVSPTDSAGPVSPTETGRAEAVWLTAESLGRTDPALLGHSELPAVFVFDEPLLTRLRLSGKRLVFLAETLVELGAEVRLGDPVEELSGRRLATTWNYVPGWKRRAALLDIVALHPWPWLRRPGSGSLQSYSAWVR